jgi:hypothetical protein
MRLKILYLLPIMVLFSSLINAQIAFKKVIDEENPLNNHILIYKRCNTEEVLIDSFRMFINHSEYSFGEHNGIIYISWCFVNFNFKCYQINTYSIQDNFLTLKEVFYIDDLIYKELFAKEMSVKFTEFGMCFSFKEGKIKEFVLSYQDLDLHILPKFLKKISRIQKMR